MRVPSENFHQTLVNLVLNLKNFLVRNQVKIRPFRQKQKKFLQFNIVIRFFVPHIFRSVVVGYRLYWKIFQGFNRYQKHFFSSFVRCFFSKYIRVLRPTNSATQDFMLRNDITVFASKSPKHSLFSTIFSRSEISTRFGILHAPAKCVSFFVLLSFAYQILSPVLSALFY